MVLTSKLVIMEKVGLGCIFFFTLFYLLDSSTILRCNNVSIHFNSTLKNLKKISEKNSKKKFFKNFEKNFLKINKTKKNELIDIHVSKKTEQCQPLVKQVGLNIL